MTTSMDAAQLGKFSPFDTLESAALADLLESVEVLQATPGQVLFVNCPFPPLDEETMADARRLTGLRYFFIRPALVLVTPAAAAAALSSSILFCSSSTLLVSSAIDEAFFSSSSLYRSLFF